MCTKSTDFLQEFSQRNKKIFKDLNNLKLTMPSSNLSQKVEKIKKKFNLLHKNWINLVSKLDTDIRQNIEKNQEISGKIRKNSKTNKKIHRFKLRIKSQEMYVEGRD